jgi:hypothetical protein
MRARAIGDQKRGKGRGAGAGGCWATMGRAVLLGRRLKTGRGEEERGHCLLELAGLRRKETGREKKKGRLG